MTALSEYQRLEAQGTWRPSPKGRRREVIVSFGDATLILSDPKSELPVSHWSLPAVYRRNPDRLPAIYSPGRDPDEELEISDELMIAAIEKVHRVLESRRPHPGRLRGGLMLASVLAMVLVAVIWLPQALINHALRVAPPAQRQAIGDAVLAEVVRATGAPCQRPGGLAAIDRLARNLGDPGARFTVLPMAISEAWHLPGNVTIIGKPLIEDQPSPEAAAGHLVAARLAAATTDPLRDVLQYAGTRATLSLLTSGALPPGALDGYGERLLSSPPARPESEPLLAKFAEVGISSEPYARSIDPTGESVLSLIEADPFRTALPERPVLSPEDWTVLKRICTAP
ncbi:hypothetical protein [Paracoccus pacificus]|uniref:Uncharacterized protein n=1 Tax=Paracoccus pacificus TaxID=1463598 RepID=A0ABW4R9Y3_9RHOB